MANWFDKLFGNEPAKPASAQVAADRLRVIVASEQRLGSRLSSEKIERMKQEIMDVVKRYVTGVDDRDVQMIVRTEDNAEMLEMNINLPEDR